PRRDGAGRGGEHRTCRRSARARAPRRRGPRAGASRSRRPLPARAPSARGDGEPGRRREALLTEETRPAEERRPVDELPPALDSPGARGRFSRLAIDLTPLRAYP